jgi:hypothetical protein
MTTRSGSKFISLFLVTPFVALTACAPAPAKLLNPADERALKIMVAPPVPCSDLKIELVNSYAGCENYGGMMDGDKFTKYTRPVNDAALMATVEVRCYDLEPEKIDNYEVCAPTIAVISRMSRDDLTASPVVPVGPVAPTSVSTQNTAGTAPNQASTSATRGSDGSREAEANAGNTSAEASSQQNSDGSITQSTGEISRTQYSDGSSSTVFNNR